MPYSRLHLCRTNSACALSCADLASLSSCHQHTQDIYLELMASEYQVDFKKRHIFMGDLVEETDNGDVKR